MAVMRWARLRAFGAAAGLLIAAPCALGAATAKSDDAQRILAPAAHSQIPGEVTLNEAEQAWLRAHPKVRVGVAASDWRPIDIASKVDGTHQGLTPDYLKLLQQRFGFEIDLVILNTWTEVMEKARAREIDLVGSLHKTPQREAYLKFTGPYLPNPMVVIARKDLTEVSGEQDLAGRTIAVEQGFATVEKLQEHYPRARQLLADSTVAALTAVARGKADVYIGGLITSTYLIDHEYLTNLEVRSSARFSVDGARFGVRGDWPEFAAILQKGIDSFTEEEHRAIRGRWVPVNAAIDRYWPKLELTALERAWIRAHPVIRVGGDREFAPFSFTDKHNEVKGLNADYLRLVGERLGLTVQFVPGLSWSEVLDAAREKHIDVVSGIARTPEHAVYLTYAGPFGSMPIVIVARLDSPVLDLKTLGGQSVALVRGDFTVDLIKRQYPGIAVTLFETTEQTLGAVAAGKAVATLDNLAVVSPLVQGRFLGSLKVAGTVPEAPNDFYFGVRKDWPQLASAINKALASVTDAEHSAIRQRWLTVRYEPGLGWRDIVQVALPIGLVVLGIVVGMMILNRRLRGQIAERRRAEAAANESSALLRDMTDNIPAGVFQYRQSSTGDVSYAFVNKGMGELHGLEREALLRNARVQLGVVHEGDLPSNLENMRHCFATGETWRGEYRVVRPDGALRWLRGEASPQPAPGGGVHWNGYFVDVTEQKAQQAALAQAKQEAEAATEAKSAFLAMMSHEIRTPMNGVLGMVEVLSLSRLDAEQKRTLAIVRDSAKALLRILNDVLDFSKIEAGRMALDPVPTDVAGLIESAVNTLAHEAHEKKLKLGIFIDRELAGEHLADAVRLRQILFNLMSNAIKFTHFGSVGVSARVMQSTAAEQTLRFTIEDTGIGIAKEAQHHLFQAFAQAEVSTARRFGGTGLGLAISQRLAKLMAGKLSMRSEPGLGTQVDFTVTLPVVKPRQVNPALYGKRALVLAASESLRLAVENYASGWGVEPVTPSTLPRERQDIFAFLDANPCDVAVLCEQTLLEKYSLTPAEMLALAQELPLGMILVTAAPGLLVEEPRPLVLRVSEDPLQPSMLKTAFKVALGLEELHDALGKTTGKRRALRVPQRAQAIAERSLILVVEDHPTNRAVLQRQLALLGYTGDYVENGEQALTAWGTGDYALVLTDLQMPGMDGFTLAQRIREAEPGARRTPILALTASALASDSAACLAAGMDDYIGKPVDLATLGAKLERWLGARAPVSDADCATPGGDEVVDLDRLRRTFGDGEVRQTLRDFLAANAHDVADLERSLKARDPEAVAALVHRMKGAAEVVGGHELVRRYDLLEQAAQCADWAAVDAEAIALREATARLEAAADAAIGADAQNDAHENRLDRETLHSFAP